jgi:sigma-B regulation protein RsbU (phosphoserine phosphatase)
MKLRWKFFFVLLVFSLIPLSIITIVSQRGTSRMGAMISEDVQQNLTRLANGILKRTAENSAAILDQSQKAVELALTALTREAEAVLAEEPPATVKAYFAPDFNDPASAPPDFGPQAGYLKKSDEGRLVNDSVSFDHPVVLLAPGVTASDAAEDIDRLTLLTDFFSEISGKLRPALHWAYVSLENGVHVSYPGHGGYPDGYDPRQRPWYVDAGDEIRWNVPLVDATSGQVVMTASKQLRHPDGARAGVVAMDVLLTEVLRLEDLSSVWTEAMRSFVVIPVPDPDELLPGLLIVAQKDYQSQAASWEGSINPERLTSDDPERLNQLVNELGRGRTGYLEMPYKGTASIWAFAPLGKQSCFIVIVPKSVVDRVPRNTVHIVQKYTGEELLITAAAAVGAILLATLAAFMGSRSFTRPIYELAEAAGRLSRGDFAVRVLRRTGDERDRVIQAFNDMVPKLEDHLRMHESLKLATEVQQNLLPQREPSLPGLDIAGLSMYCDETGGDYYDYLEVSKDPLGAAAVVVADVSGHGAHAALLMASARAALRLRAALPGGPSEIVADVNRQFTADVGNSGAFMTLFYLAIDSTRKTLRWVRAGHDPAIVFDPNSERFEELSGRGSPLGLDADALFEENERRNLQPGGVILIGTDGIWETAAPDGRLFGKEALRELIRNVCAHSARDITKAVVQALEEFRHGLKPADDITMVVIKIL